MYSWYFDPDNKKLFLFISNRNSMIKKVNKHPEVQDLRLIPV
jgi:hypothetical protein